VQITSELQRLCDVEEAITCSMQALKEDAKLQSVIEEDSRKFVALSDRGRSPGFDRYQAAC
jgi:hypothetical protein